MGTFARVDALERRRLLAASVQGSVIEDANANGVQDGNESLPIWTPTVFADLNYNGSLDVGEPSATQPFSQSSYRLQLPSGGTYLIRAILPDFYVATIPASGSRVVTINDGLTTLGTNFGGWRSGQYNAAPFVDTNGNGAKEDTEGPAYRRALWADLDRDGVMDPIEPASTPDGPSARLALRPGSYSMRLNTPPGWANTTAPNGLERTITAGNLNFPEPLGQQATRNVLGTVAQDDNGSEQLEPSDTVLAGWTAFADLNKNGVRESGEPLDVTKADGTYALIGSALGSSFNLRLISPGGQVHPFSRAYASGYTENAFGNDDVLLAVTNVAQGRMFADLNGNGVYESTNTYREYFAPGQVVYADVDNDGQRDPGEAFTRTDTGGTFVFAVPGGTYAIRPEASDDYAVNPSFPAFARTTFGGNARVTLGALGLVDNRPARSHAHVAGLVFHDLDRDGRWDPGEQPQPGQTVYIDVNANLRRDVDEPSAVTGADGRYQLLDQQTTTGAGPLMRVETVSGWRNTQQGLNEGTNVQIYSGQTAGASLGIYAVPDVGIASTSFDANDRRTVDVTFTHDLGHSLQAGDFVLSMFFNGAWVTTSAQWVIESRTVQGGRSVARLRLAQALPDGQYRMILLPQAIADAAGVKNPAAQVVAFSFAPPPQVAGVFVSGTGWAPAFRAHLAQQSPGEPAAGFRINPANPLDELPWTNLNQVSVRFSRDVNVAQGSLAVQGAAVASYPVSGFVYDRQTFTATWTLATSGVGADKLAVNVAGVTDAATGLALDGEWPGKTAGAFPSGNGTAGGTFRFRFNVLPGDVNRNASVSATDMNLVKLAQGAAPGSSRYSAFADVNGSNTIMANDVNLVRARQGAKLPSAEPAVTASAATATPLASSKKRLVDDLL